MPGIHEQRALQGLVFHHDTNGNNTSRSNLLALVDSHQNEWRLGVCVSLVNLLAFLTEYSTEKMFHVQQGFRLDVARGKGLSHRCVERHTENWRWLPDLAILGHSRLSIRVELLTFFFAQNPIRK